MENEFCVHPDVARAYQLAPISHLKHTDILYSWLREVISYLNVMAKGFYFVIASRAFRAWTVLQILVKDYQLFLGPVVGICSLLSGIWLCQGIAMCLSKVKCQQLQL